MLDTLLIALSSTPVDPREMVTVEVIVMWIMRLHNGSIRSPCGIIAMSVIVTHYFGIMGSLSVMWI